ncbi:hypothetical protein COLO4_13964 [Corchorus olitorius]|uniref:F-box associated beta-propeller type 1 domain-containing protein n=1 Tax=Corchorus olitorius TaxID=93759 RepID=A0A1R3JUE4_9ROSI|nr:hypothetical protein COLO4_13964 [Corchorus olitorius]
MDFTSRFDLPNMEYFSLVNSCNGLVCLSGGEDEEEEESIYVCNPVLGEYITIQLPEESSWRCYGSFGLGFSSRSNEFKVLRTFRDENFGLLRNRTHTVKAEIYTLGTGSWRSIENVPDDIDISFLGFNSFLHGTLHWATIKGYPKFCCKIICFNFEEELFGEIPVPPQFEPDFGSGDAHHQLKLGVYDGCLSACCFRGDGAWEFDIWVMKEYGVKESWVTQFRIDAYEAYCETDFYIEEDNITGCYPLIFLKNGEIMFSFNNQFVVSYNLERETLRDTGLFHTTGEFDAVGYTPCFVSLEDVVKGEQITRYSTMLL